MAFFPAGDPTSGVRAMALDYEIPAYLPGALPIRVRRQRHVLPAGHARGPGRGGVPRGGRARGQPGWGPEQQVLLGFTLEQACAGRTRVEDLR